MCLRALLTYHCGSHRKQTRTLIEHGGSLHARCSRLLEANPRMAARPLINNRFKNEPYPRDIVDPFAIWRWPWLLWRNGWLGSIWMEPAGDYLTDYYCVSSNGQAVTDKTPTVNLSVGKIAEHQLRSKGDALGNAYRDFLNRIIRQQKTIDKLKRDCGVK